MFRAPLRLALAVLLAGVASGCGGAGPYGHAREYVPLSGEEKAAKGAVDYDPVMAKRMPDQWLGKKLSVFGIVKKRDAGTGGSAKVQLSVRILENRNLCENQRSESTCRVTVSEREHAVIHAQVKLKGDDDIGPKSVGIGSLVRVIGTMRDSVDASDGNPVIEVDYYRHWPRNFYVTTAARNQMRH